MTDLKLQEFIERKSRASRRAWIFFGVCSVLSFIHCWYYSEVYLANSFKERLSSNLSAHAGIVERIERFYITTDLEKHLANGLILLDQERIKEIEILVAHRVDLSALAMIIGTFLPSLCFFIYSFTSYRDYEKIKKFLK